MDPIIKAKELGEAIAASEEMAELKMYEAALEADKYASKLLEEYYALLVRVAQAEREKQDQGVIMEIKSKLKEKTEEISRCDTAKGYLAAKNRFDRLMRTVNDVIAFGMTGEEPQDRVGCAGGGCGSCMCNRTFNVPRA